MIGAFITAVVWFVLLLPFRLVYYFFAFTRLRLILSLISFVFGLLSGLVGGYFYFIYPLSTDVPPLDLPDIGQQGKELNVEDKKRYFVELPPWVSSPDFERMDWLNALLDLMWPHIDKAVAAQVVEQAAPMIAQYKPKFIDSIDFESLTLGKEPPAIIGIKSFDTHDDEVIIQPVLRWFGEPNILVAAKAYNMKATVQFTDLTFEAVARITLKPLVPVFPCFAKITVSLMAPPKLDFGLKVLGLDVMSIPIVPLLVQKTVNDVVAGMLLWPNCLEVYDETPAKPVGWLVVSGLKASHLRDTGGLLGTADPYVRLSLGHALGVKTTGVEENTLNPEWHDAFKMRVTDPEKEVLTLDIYDKEKTRDKLMGVQQIALSLLTPGETKSFTLPVLPSHPKKDPPPSANSADPAAGAAAATAIAAATSPPASTEDDTKRKDMGTISVQLLYTPFTEDEAKEQSLAETNNVEEVVFPDTVPVGGGVLRVIPHSGRGLEAKHHYNPKLHLRLRNKEWESKVYKKSKQIDEFTDEPFSVELPAPPHGDMLHVKVFSKNLSSLSIGSGKEVIGHCDIPLRDVIANGRINEEFTLIDSQQGMLKIELQWHERTADSPVVHVDA